MVEHPAACRITPLKDGLRPNDKEDYILVRSTPLGTYNITILRAAGPRGTPFGMLEGVKGWGKARARAVDLAHAYRIGIVYMEPKTGA